MSCPWRPPLETASDCPGQEALDKASYVGLSWPCRAGALAPRQLPKNHTASPREGPLWPATHVVRGTFYEPCPCRHLRRMPVVPQLPAGFAAAPKLSAQGHERA